MQLTTQQLQTLKAWVNTNASGIYEPSTAALLNALASPSYQVYKTSVTQAEVMLNGFDWVRVDNLSVGKARIWEWLFGVNGTIDPSKQNVRAGINEAWKGTSADLAVRAAVYAHCHRGATVAEELFATGAGTLPDASGDGPGVMAAEGAVTLDNLIAAANS